MYRLIMDTSTSRYYLCLAKNEDVVEELLYESNKNHAPYSVMLIDELLKKHNITIDDIKEVICGIGPGSYTGVRIAVTIAKMICSLKNIPFKSISTLYLMSSGYDLPLASMIDARRGNYFSCIYNTTYVEEKVRTLEEVNDMGLAISFISEDMFKVNLKKVIEKAKLEEKVDEVVPNYLRITEAEYNLKNKDD